MNSTDASKYARKNVQQCGRRTSSAPKRKYLISIEPKLSDHGRLVKPERFAHLTSEPILGTKEPIMGTVLDHLFPATRRSLLVAFYREPDRRFYLREIINFVGKGMGAVQRELANLVAAGLIERKDEHGRSYYAAKRSSPCFQDVYSLVCKNAGVELVLKDALSALKEIEIAFIFGSIARGDERSDSDIDLAVVGDVSFRDVVLALHQVQVVLGREINPVVGSRSEFSRRWKVGEPFIVEIFEGEKRFVIGKSDDIRKMA